MKNPNSNVGVISSWGVLDLASAVHKASGLAAAHVGLQDRGVIAPGMAADLVLFDPERVRDRATPEEPHALAEGIERVWVNGVGVYEAGRATGRLPGRVLRRPGSETDRRGESGWSGANAAWYKSRSRTGSALEGV